ncbi:hypothetical protein [Halomicrobium urmianum]|uniref:hypothetical protein n=1 Tax=Halomicrobium urmianum TaxID=1586233 RepID=UPI001CDA0674|nr:hypothetical protein [Halomicrobium urmianum]
MLPTATGAFRERAASGNDDLDPARNVLIATTDRYVIATRQARTTTPATAAGTSSVSPGAGVARSSNEYSLANRLLYAIW